MKAGEFDKKFDAGEDVMWIAERLERKASSHPFDPAGSSSTGEHL